MLSTTGGEASQDTTDDHHPTIARGTRSTASWGSLSQTGQGLFEMHSVQGLHPGAHQPSGLRHLSGPLPPSMWNGSQTHTMIRCGASAECTRCKARGRINDGTVVISKRLRDPCPSRSKGLRDLFG